MSKSIFQAFDELKLSKDSPTDDQRIYEITSTYLSDPSVTFGDLSALRNCLVSLINMDAYHKALAIIEKIPSDEIKLELVLEISYVHYKLGHFKELEELFETASSKGKVSHGLKNILAQTFYKMGFYDKALSVFYELVESGAQEKSLELLVNEKSAISQLNFQTGNGFCSKFSDIVKSHDLLFNEALVKLSLNQRKEALRLLQESEEVLMDQNREIESKDLQTELLPLRLTTAYIYTIEGDDKKTLAIFKDLRSENIEDSLLALILKNNYYAAISDKPEINLIARDVNYQKNLHSLSQKLTVGQSKLLTSNNLFSKFVAGTLGASYLNNSSMSRSGGDDLTRSLYKAMDSLDIAYCDLAFNSCWTTSKKLVKYIMSESGVYSEKIAAVLLLTSLNEKLGKFDQSILVLEHFVLKELSREKMTPILFKLLIKVYERIDSNTKLQEIYDKLIPRFLMTPKHILTEDPNYFKFAKEIGFQLYSRGDSRFESIFKLLIEIDSSDELISAIMLQSDSGLLSIESLASHKGIEELLSPNVEALAPAKSTRIVAPKPGSSKVEKKKRKAKFSSSKVYKTDYDADEERWLPMKLRSYYRPSKKDKKKTSSVQGAVSAVAATGSNNSNTISQKAKKKKKKTKK